MIIKVHQIRYSKLLIALLLFVACSAPQKPSTLDGLVNGQTITVSAELLQMNATAGLVYYQGKPFTGAAQSYYADSVLATHDQYVDGKKHGLSAKWFNDGTLSYEGYYVVGKLDGMTKTWWNNGNLRTQNNFEAGVPHGEQIQWYKSGIKFKQMNLVYGKEEGLQRSWRENGKLFNNYEAHDGRIFGLKRSKLCYKLEDEQVRH